MKNNLTLVEKVRNAHCGLSLSASVKSPYFQTTDMRKVGADRDTKLFLEIMAVTKAIATSVGPYNQDLGVNVQFYDNATFVDEYNIELTDKSQYTSQADIAAYANTLILAYASAHGYSSISSASNVIWLAQPLEAALPPVASTLSVSLQTSTGAVGTQVSATRNSYVMLNGLVSTTANIGGASSGDIILEVAPTNSATAGDWVEWGRIGNSQTLTLAITLNSVQVTKGMAVCFVPAGYYVKARTSGSGTVSYTLTNAKQILI